MEIIREMTCMFSAKNRKTEKDIKAFVISM